MKIFIIESPNPNDLLESRNERASLENMCKMFGHQVASFFTYTKADFENIIKYVSNVQLDDDEFLCLHISCHGNSDGIKIGDDFVYWKIIARSLDPIFKNEHIGKKTIIILSACGANNQQITTEINKLPILKRKQYYFPNYFFVYNQDEVLWTDALLCWSILYHQLIRVEDLERENIRNVLNSINNFGTLKYFRWNETRFIYGSFSASSI